MKNLLFIGLVAGFVFLGISAYNEAKPTDKEMRIYNLIKDYSPFFLEKRPGGLSIVSKITGKKEKPPAMTIFARLEDLEGHWGSTHLKIENNSVVIMDDNKTEIGKIELHTDSEKEFVTKFYRIKKQ